jgi:hypothetical protein
MEQQSYADAHILNYYINLREIYDVTISEQSDIIFRSRQHLSYMNPMTMPVIPIPGCNSKEFTLYNTETWMRKLIQIQKLTEEHSLSCKRCIRLLNKGNNQTTQITVWYNSEWPSELGPWLPMVHRLKLLQMQRQSEHKILILIALTKIHKIKSSAKLNVQSCSQNVQLQ